MDMNVKNNPAIGRSWDEVSAELFTPEEVATSDRRVAIIVKLIQAREAAFSALCEYLDEIEPDESVRKAVKARIKKTAYKGKILDVEKVEALCRAKRRKNRQ